MPASQVQVRLAHEVLEGRSDQMPRTVAQEIVDKMHGRKMASLPLRVVRPRIGRPKRRR